MNLMSCAVSTGADQRCAGGGGGGFGGQGGQGGPVSGSEYVGVSMGGFRGGQQGALGGGAQAARPGVPGQPGAARAGGTQVGIRNLTRETETSEIIDVVRAYFL